MKTRSITEDDLARLKQERHEADRRYNDALTALDAAVQSLPDLPHPPPGPDEHQVTPLNERWNILTATPPFPTGWRGRLARFVWNLVEPVFTQQQAFNSALVDHVNRNIAPSREVPKSILSIVELVRQQLESAIHFQTRLILLAQQFTPYVDTKDYEFSGLARRAHEDDAEIIDLASERIWQRIEFEVKRLADERQQVWQRVEFEADRQTDLEKVLRGFAGGVSGLSEEMLKRFESATAQQQRFEAGLNELTGSVASLQHLTQTLRRDLERRVAEAIQPATPAQPGVTAGSRLPTADLPAQPAEPASPAQSAEQLLASDPIHSHQYVGFEDLYRGSEIDIRGRMADYARMFAGASDVLDVGCGRGELLTLLREQGVAARGIDLNHEMVERCRAAGLDVTEADALAYISSLPDESLGGIIATQVVEHLPPDYLLRLLTMAFDKLRPNGRLVLETINPTSWAAFFDSYIRDLTHMRPVHPDTLRYLVTASGFADATIAWRSPYPAESKLQLLSPTIRSALANDATLAPLAEAFDDNVERLNGLFFTHMDYAVVARRP